MEAHGKPVASALVPLRDARPKPWANHLKCLIECNSSGAGWQAKLAQTLARLDERMENGDYPPTPGSTCKHCGFAALCMRPVDITEYVGEEEDD
jgi:antitoxin (DNA-binding transcriptional repressor) of toxin-antitoxin stability system